MVLEDLKLIGLNTVLADMDGDMDDEETEEKDMDDMDMDDEENGDEDGMGGDDEMM